ncbi:MAG: hypothetical protein E6R04_06350 [Spirochaetes bacterium]|nr:MAG: hypothetical protein E6R04_06350 [Spirochaetota bacterium]
MAQALPFIGIGLQLIGAVQNANAARVEGAAQQAQLEAQASASRFNAEVAKQNAAITAEQTKANLEKADRERRIRLGRNVAAASASGTGAGSFGDILQSSSAQEELNLLTIRSEGLLKERSYLQNAALDTASAQNALNQVPLVKSAAKTKSASAILSGISSGINTASNMGMF